MYEIYKEGDLYISVNSATGEIAYSGTDFMTVLNNTINICGHVILRKGVYPVNETIHVVSNHAVIIEGE